ncbi:MAG TPA: TetR/AcrR family transcriptional regulator [Caulobacteraceae bacterium]|jgi:AcrR family transcriptional regulator
MRIFKPMPDSPRPRGDKRQRTRQTLIAATLAVVEERGFAGASLEEIARRAGMSRGAIYSNFADRDELLTAAVASQGMTLDRDFSRPLPLKAQLRRFAENLVAELPVAAGTGRIVIDYQLYCMTQPQLRARLAGVYEQSFAAIAAQFEAQYGAALAGRAHTLALAVQALAMGFVWQFMLTPGEVTPAAVYDAFDALAAGMEPAT